MIIASYLNHLPDGQRGTRWKADKAPLQPLIDSCKRVGVPLVILNNCFNDDAVFKFVEPQHNILPNMARWLLIREYLKRNPCEWFFCVDSTDVEVLRMPEIERGKIYSGDEYNMTVDNEWMQRYQRCHVRLKGYDEVIHNNAKKTLLNCGVVGGYYEDVYPFIIELSALHKLHSTHVDVKAAGSTDMATYNYLIYKRWIEKVVHGYPVCTKFKQYETESTAWFKHK